MGDDNPPSDKPCFELYIKASTRDGESKGSCPVCQQWFMVAHLLAEKGDVHFQVYTVPANNLPDSFKAKTMSKQFPIVIGVSGNNSKRSDISNIVYDDADEVEKFFESVNSSYPLLKRTEQKNQTALRNVEDLYTKFNLFLQNRLSEEKFNALLKKVDDYLGEMETTFLCGSSLSYSDTVLLCRLQHIRVAGQAYRNYKIPDKFRYIWRYLQNAYQTKSFSQTLPCDQDIVLHYETKAVRDGSTDLRICKLEEPRYTTSIDSCLDEQQENHGFEQQVEQNHGFEQQVGQNHGFEQQEEQSDRLEQQVEQNDGFEQQVQENHEFEQEQQNGNE